MLNIFFQLRFNVELDLNNLYSLFYNFDLIF